MGRARSGRFRLRVRSRHARAIRRSPRPSPFSTPGRGAVRPSSREEVTTARSASADGPTGPLRGLAAAVRCAPVRRASWRGGRSPPMRNPLRSPPGRLTWRARGSLAIASVPRRGERGHLGLRPGATCPLRCCVAGGAFRRVWRGAAIAFARSSPLRLPAPGGTPVALFSPYAGRGPFAAESLQRSI